MLLCSIAFVFYSLFVFYSFCVLYMHLSQPHAFLSKSYCRTSAMLVAIKRLQQRTQKTDDLMDGKHVALWIPQKGKCVAVTLIRQSTTHHHSSLLSFPLPLPLPLPSHSFLSHPFFLQTTWSLANPRDHRACSPPCHLPLLPRFAALQDPGVPPLRPSRPLPTFAAITSKLISVIA